MAIININNDKLPVRFHKSKQTWSKTNTLKFNTEEVFLPVKIPLGNKNYVVKVFDLNGSNISYIRVSYKPYFSDHSNYLLLRVTNTFYKGVCYIQISEGLTFNLISDPFCFVDQKLNKITYWSECGSVGSLIYPDGVNVKNSINFSNEVVVLLGDNAIEVETVEDGYGEETAVQRKLIQKYNFSDYVPNHIAEAYSLIPFHEFIEMEINNEKFTIKNIDIIFESDQVGYNTSVSFTFEIDRVIETVCCAEISEIFIKSPALFLANVISSTEIQVVWNGSSAVLGVKGHWVGRKRKGAILWSDIFVNQINNNDTSYFMNYENLIPNTVYEFRVKTEDYQGNFSEYIYIEAVTNL